MLTKEKEVVETHVKPDGSIFEKIKVRILEDGEEIATVNETCNYKPGESTADAGEVAKKCAAAMQTEK